MLQKEYVRTMGLLPGYRWWKPLLALALAILFFLVFQILFVVVFLACLITLQSIGANDVPTLQGILQGLNNGVHETLVSNDPSSIVFALAPFALALPAIALSLKITGLGHLGTISSVEGRIRWDRLGTYLVVSLVCILLLVFLIPWATDAPLEKPANMPSPHIVPGALLAILLLTPLQSASEEYLFRGFMTQLFGSCIPFVLVPVVLQALIFAVTHFYDPSSTIAVACMGATMGFLTVKLGGLEAAIAFHTVNNLSSFLFASLFSSSITLGQDRISTLMVAISIYLVYAGAALLIAAKNGWIAVDPPYVRESPSIRIPRDF